jgi:hypothetical protein
MIMSYGIVELLHFQEQLPNIVFGNSVHCTKACLNRPSQAMGDSRWMGDCLNIHLADEPWRTYLKCRFIAHDRMTLCRFLQKRRN